MYQDYGEPDVVLTFTGDGQAPVVIIVEVKLNSGKSGTGTDDQLERYLQLLDNGITPATRQPGTLRCVVFLTRACILQELEDSAQQCHWTGDAQDRIAGLEWNDVLEVASSEAARIGLHGGGTHQMLLK